MKVCAEHSPPALVIAASPLPSHDFGAVGVVSVSAPQSFVVSNTGQAPLVLGSISLSNPGEYPVLRDGCSNRVLPPTD